MNKEIEEAKKSIRRTRIQITFLVGLLGVLLFTIIALVIWAIIQEQKTPTSFAECVTYKDAKILESYPEQCVVKGKSFANPDQKVVLPEPVKDELSSDAWLLYTPDNEAYTIKLIDGWSYVSYNTGKTEVLVACSNKDSCVYKESAPAQMTNKNGAVDKNAKLTVTYGEEPILASTYLAAGEIELKNGDSAKKYAYNDGTKTTYVYLVKGAKDTVTVTYSNDNDDAESLKYVEEMVSTTAPQ
jgi:hypothetical protein